MVTPKFEVVPDDLPDDEVPKAEKRGFEIDVLMLALGALSKRTLVAIDNLFCLLTVFLVFWLWKSIPEPNTYQLIELGIFALFVLAANVIVRRK